MQRRFESGVIDLDFALADTGEFLDSVERREQRADSRAIARLLLAASIAVIGASDTQGTVGDALWRSGSPPIRAGALYPVNPNHATIGGRAPPTPAIADIPDDVALAVVAVPAEQLAAVIDQCIAKRVRGAVIVTSVDDAPTSTCRRSSPTPGATGCA